MTVYIDVVLIINFIIDLLLLMTVSYVLKRNVSSNRLIIGALSGSLSLLLLFLKLNNITLFLLKFFISIIMVICTFGFKNIKYTFKNMMYLYIISILLGGFLYFINNSFSYSNKGLFFYKGKSISYIFILCLSPIIMYLYYKQSKELKNNYNNYYKVDIFIKDSVITINGYLDTGNKLIDPYLKRPVILLNRKRMIDNIDDLKKVYVPYQTVSESNLLMCFIADKVVIDDLGYKEKVLVGLIDDYINIDNIDLILNTKLMEELNV